MFMCVCVRERDCLYLSNSHSQISLLWVSGCNSKNLGIIVIFIITFIFYRRYALLWRVFILDGVVIIGCELCFSPIMTSFALLLFLRPPACARVLQDWNHRRGATLVWLWFLDGATGPGLGVHFKSPWPPQPPLTPPSSLHSGSRTAPQRSGETFSSISTTKERLTCVLRLPFLFSSLYVSLPLLPLSLYCIYLHICFCVDH